MSRIFQAVQEVFKMMNDILKYFIERVVANYQILRLSGKVIVILVIFILILVVIFTIIIMLRIGFQYSLKDLKNIRTEYQITINRANGKKCNLIYEVLLFQKLIVIDDEILPIQNETKVLLDTSMMIGEKDRTYNIVSDEPKISMMQLFASSSSIILVFVLLYFDRYKDFDIIFKSIHNLKYQEYVISSNLGSLLFVFGFAISILFTIFIWVYVFSKSDWKKNSQLKSLLSSFEIVSMIPVFIAIIMFINVLFISPAAVTRQSMVPNYYEGDTIFVLHTEKYERFDVVIVLGEEGKYYPEYEVYTRNEYYIKRIIGLPGETVNLEYGKLYVNGIILDESEYLLSNMQTYCQSGNEYNVTESCSFVVPEGEYFLLGDNRINSLDSRLYGPYKSDNIYGKVIFKFR